MFPAHPPPRPFEQGDKVVPVRARTLVLLKAIFKAIPHNAVGSFVYCRRGQGKRNMGLFGYVNRKLLNRKGNHGAPSGPPSRWTQDDVAAQTEWSPVVSGSVCMRTHTLEKAARNRLAFRSTTDM